MVKDGRLDGWSDAKLAKLAASQTAGMAGWFHQRPGAVALLLVHIEVLGSGKSSELLWSVAVGGN